MKYKIETQKYIINRLDSYIDSSQNKSNLYLVLNTIILGGIVTLISLKVDTFTCMLNTLLGIIAFLSFISIIFTLKAINPYLKSNKDKKSIFFFYDINKMNQEDYYKSILGQSEEELLKDITGQTNIIANGLYTKYKDLRLIGWIIGFEFLLLLIWIITYLITKS